MITVQQKLKEAKYGTIDLEAVINKTSELAPNQVKELKETLSILFEDLSTKHSYVKEESMYVALNSTNYGIIDIDNNKRTMLNRINRFYHGCEPDNNIVIGTFDEFKQVLEVIYGGAE